MRDKNYVELRGHLGDDPKLTVGETGQARCSMRLCTNSEYVNKAGETVEKAVWHNIVAWGRTAENAAKYLRKGSQAEVEGRILYREYEDAKKVTRNITEVVANQIDYGRSPKAKTAEPETPVAATVQTTSVRRKQNEVTASSNFQTDDDIPF